MKMLSPHVNEFLDKNGLLKQCGQRVKTWRFIMSKREKIAFNFQTFFNNKVTPPKYNPEKNLEKLLFRHWNISEVLALKLLLVVYYML